MNFKEFKEQYQKIEVVEVRNDVTSQPMISVLVQTYQHAAYIIKCLDGILMQETTFPFEIIVGEDASKDGTREICLEYAKNYPDKIRLFLHNRQNNIKIDGNPTGRFVLIYNLFVARGKYIALCEGDDFWINSQKLQNQVGFLEANPEYLFSMGRVDILIDKTGEIKKAKDHVKPSKEETYELKDYLKGRFSQTSSFVFRNNITNFPKWFLNAHAGDQSLVVLIVGSKGKIKYHNQLFSIYRRNPNSMSNTSKYNVFGKFLVTISDWEKFLDNEYKNIFYIIKLKNKQLLKLTKTKNFILKVIYYSLIKLLNLILKII